MLDLQLLHMNIHSHVLLFQKMYVKLKIFFFFVLVDVDLSLVRLNKADDAQEALTAFGEDTADRQLLLNVEYKGANTDHVLESLIFLCFELTYETF